MAWQAQGLWGFLENETIEEKYEWRKEEREFACCYVCYYLNKEIGFIPIVYSASDEEWVNWWNQAYKRHKDLTLKILIYEIIDRHKNKL
jgi:hypothetical protein